VRRLHFWKEVRRLPVQRWERVLDAGCGPGHLALEFAYRFPHIEVIGYDLHASFLVEKGKAQNLNLRQKNLFTLDEHNCYDFIWCIDVLEHISGNRQVVESFLRALKPGGYLYVHIPHDMPGKRVFPERYFTAFNEWAHEEHVGKQYTLEEVCVLLQAIGFSIVRKQWTFGLLGELAWEADRLTDSRMALKVMLTTLMKALARLSVSIRAGKRHGNVLAVGLKVHA
jgi:SAM-dependent methyltransferase